MDGQEDQTHLFSGSDHQNRSSSCSRFYTDCHTCILEVWPPPARSTFLCMTQLSWPTEKQLEGGERQMCNVQATARLFQHHWGNIKSLRLTWDWRTQRKPDTTPFSVKTFFPCCDFSYIYLQLHNAASRGGGAVAKLGLVDQLSLYIYCHIIPPAIAPFAPKHVWFL